MSLAMNLTRKEARYFLVNSGNGDLRLPRVNKILWIVPPIANGAATYTITNEGNDTFKVAIVN